jgi:glucose-1-phosphate cytidylyltransferase
MDQIDSDESIWERRPFEHLTADSLLAYRRRFGFWKPMNNLRDKRELAALWTDGLSLWPW